MPARGPPKERAAYDSEPLLHCQNRVECKSLFLNPESTLILASTSAYRRALLERLQIHFRVASPRVDERAQARETPLALARRLARAKAAAVARTEPEAWIIGSDQVAACGRRVLGKPLTRERCIEQLRSCSGRRVRFITAVTLMRAEGGRRFEAVDTTQVRFRRLDDASIERYVDREQPLDCAGGFKSEGLGISLFESIESRDPTALIGLPLIALSRLLRRAGFTLP